MADPELGLRERKRRATLFAIQRSALEIANEEGLSAVTVEAVSRRADISPRTFFNYFPTKEQALLGPDPTLPDDEELATFIAGGPTGDLLHDVGWLFTHTTKSFIDGRGLQEERHRLLRDHPEFFTQRMAAMKKLQRQLESTMAARLANDDPELASNEEALTRRARLVTLVALATLRHAWWDWSDSSEDASLVDAVSRSFAALDTLISREHE